MQGAIGSAKSVTELPVVVFADPKAWEKRIAKNHPKSPGVWIRFAKKNSGIGSVTYAEALDVALAYGWIDSQKKSHDDNTFLQKFTPRGKRSIFATLSSQNRYAILFRLHTAKKAETRARRLAQFTVRLERHETIHP